jgi:hypothetical protein
MLHVHPLLGNGLVNTLPQKKMRGTIGRVLLGDEAVNTHPSQQMTVFSVVSVQRSYLEDNRRYKFSYKF